MRYGIIFIGLAALQIPLAADAQGDVATKTQTVADQIVCPLQELEWGAGQSFPDPWYSTTHKVAFSYGPTTTSMPNGTEAMMCTHLMVSQIPPQPKPAWMPSWKEPPKNRIHVIRPHNPNVGSGDWPCPPTIQVRVLTPLPAQWVGSYYVWQLKEKWFTSQYGNWGVDLGQDYDVCEYDPSPGGNQVQEPRYIVYPLNPVAQTPVTGLAATPVPIPTPDNLQQAFLVTKAQLTAIGAKRTTSCPATVRFEGRIGANGPGQVRWRREVNGQLGPIQTLGFSSAGEKIVRFETQVVQTQQPAGGMMLTTQAQPSNVVNGLVRMVIESPAGVSESNMTSYEITCSALDPAGNLAQTPLPPEPTPQSIAAPAPATSPAPGAARAVGTATAAPTRTAPTRATAAVAASAPRSVTYKTRRVPLRLRDGRSGWVEFDIVGEIGGQPRGRMTVVLTTPAGEDARTEYRVSGGTVQRNETDYEFVLQAAGRTTGEARARRVTSRLTLSVPPGATDPAASGQQTWHYEGMTCTGSDKDGWVCT